MVVEITPIGIESLGWQFYIIWTVFNAAFVPIVYLFYPETADRSLEDIDRLFRENNDILSSGIRTLQVRRFSGVGCPIDENEKVPGPSLSAYLFDVVV